jgi:hypothetical protein
LLFMASLLKKKNPADRRGSSEWHHNLLQTL